MSRKRRAGKIHKAVTSWADIHSDIGAESSRESLVSKSFNIFLSASLISSAPEEIKAATSTYISEISKRYNDVPYHSFEHAVHVLSSVNFLLKNTSNVFTPVEELAIIFAALIHDVDHFGVSNATLNSESHPYSLLYNDVSVAEMRSLTLAFELLSDEDKNFIRFLSEDERKRFRKTVIGAVLNTDIADVERKTGFFSKLDAACSADAFDIFVEENRQLGLEAILKVSDIGSILQSFDTSVFWSYKYYLELSKAHQDGRGFPVVKDGFLSFQMAHFNGYVSLLIAKLEKLKIIEEAVMASMSSLLEENITRWSSNGDEIISSW